MRVFWASSLLLCLVVPPGDGAPRDLRVEVLIYNYAQVPRKILGQAEVEATRIYLRTGIVVEWLACPLTPAEADQFPECQVPLTPTRLVLRIFSDSRAERMGLTDSTFGSTLFPDNGGFPTVAQVCGRCSEELARGDSAMYARILGDIMAHELGHLLLGKNRHSRAGLMHVPWSKPELKSVAEGTLLFTSKERDWLRRQVLVRQFSTN
jgi:hypothetical protein